MSSKMMIFKTEPTISRTAVKELNQILDRAVECDITMAQLVKDLRAWEACTLVVDDKPVSKAQSDALVLG